MNNVIDHDRLFKELIATFFVEFIQLFFPEIINYLEPNQITFLDKEVFTDVTEGEKYESDLVAQVQFRGQSSFFLIHLEAQSSSQPEFNRRMFTYFARLHQKFALPVYPIVIFSYDRPQKEAIRQYKIEFPDLKVLEFNYQVVQLNRLNWRDFINQPNPVAAALMAKMKIAPRDRAKVKAQCLRLLVTLRLDAARMQLISGFVDTYLNLNSSEEIEFQQEISTFIQPEQEGVMQITTSWMRRGLEQGLEQGLERGLEQGLARERNLIIRLIKRKLGAIDVDIESRIMPLNIDDLERVGEALLDFSTVEDLTNWLNALDA
ncbi:MAG: Rpn family recombination-promoting nuclease/putative transposase [Microcystis sp.]|uniref:Rpn family recombination-promoting nuclease/putative transposase n=1 Tax=Microcystis sp. TaxID=1127 RepID=UPI0039195E64